MEGSEIVMLIIHMKSGKQHHVDLDMPTFEELHSDERYNTISAGNLHNEKSVHIIPKDQIESVEVVWSGTMEELKEAAKNYVL